MCTGSSRHQSRPVVKRLLLLLLASCPTCRRPPRALWWPVLGRSGARRLEVGPELRANFKKLVGSLLIIVESHLPALGDGDVKQTHPMGSIGARGFVNIC
jgi:hypothetical protein